MLKISINKSYWRMIRYTFEVMAFRCSRLLRAIKAVNSNRLHVYSTTVTIPQTKVNKPTEFVTENNLVYYEDPDKFGNLAPQTNSDKVILEDEGDIEEEKHLSEKPIPSQKLTIRQYADLIKQYLEHKRLKEAIDVLEVRMLQEDRVKPENYIYNILIGACADVGYTKKAFKLFNDMKRRALKPTGDTYTSLFHACSNSPWPNNGLKLATHLRDLMIEKGVEPNLTNYNSMIKAFGRCGDLTTAFKIVDEMVSKQIKIRVHTFNHLLQACISDKEHGLRHALIVWRKMLKMREKPNIYSFNLMLKCVKDCNLGSQADIQELIGSLQDQVQLEGKKTILKIEGSQHFLEQSGKDIEQEILNKKSHASDNTWPKFKNVSSTKTTSKINIDSSSPNQSKESNEITILGNSNISMQLVNLPVKQQKEERTLPNLLSKVLKMDHVQALREVKSLQDKFAVIGGQEDFLNEMNVYSIKPDVKTFTQMLPLLEDTVEAENQLLAVMKELDMRTDIDFYNMLIKKRCLRLDYDSAFEIMKIIKKEGKIRKKRFPDRKKLHLSPNIMTYGVLAMACKTKENAETLLSQMEEAKIKVNIEILGTLLRQGTVQSNFGYVLYIMNIVKDQNLKPNPIFMKHLESFHDKCTDIANQPKANEVFKKAFRIFSMAYKNWLQNFNVDEILAPENPWAQFNENYPNTLQRQNINIKEPKKFYKRTRKFIKYKPTV